MPFVAAKKLQISGLQMKKETSQDAHSTLYGRVRAMRFSITMPTADSGLLKLRKQQKVLM